MTIRTVARTTLKSSLYVAALSLVPFASTARAQIAPGGPAFAPAAQLGNAQAADLEAMDQGPIHEAFAEPIALNAEPEPAVPREPPPPIEELPPEARPEGNNVQWIPGYWKFSDEVADFVWVTGLWRDVPPGREWVPGYWTEADGGYAWVYGYWGQTNQREERFLPIPPTTLEIGPSSPAPSDSYFWIPGCWIWRTSGYVWRTGYWYAGQPNWVWVPSHYAFTPRGALYVHGYWDYPVIRRGLLFAPVRPVAGFAFQVGYRWRPYRVLDSSLLLTSLFVHGRYGQYYYGHGGWRSPYIYPWYAVKRHHRPYDPLFAYHQWHDGRGHSDWARKYEHEFDRRGQGGSRNGQRGGDFENDRDPGRGPRTDRSDLVKNVKDLPKSQVVSRRAVDVDRRDFDHQSQRARLAQTNRRELERSRGDGPPGVDHHGPDRVGNASGGRVAGGVATTGPAGQGGGRGRGSVGDGSSVRSGIPPVRGEFGATARAQPARSSADGVADATRGGRVASDDNRRDVIRQFPSSSARNDLIRRSGPPLGNDGPARNIVRDQRNGGGQVSGETRRVESARPIIRGNDAPQGSPSREAFQAPSRAGWGDAARSRAESSARGRMERSTSESPQNTRMAPPSRGSFQQRETPPSSQSIRRQAPSSSTQGSARAAYTPQQRGSLRSVPQSAPSRGASSGGRAQIQRSTSRGPSPAAQGGGNSGASSRGVSRGGGNRGGGGRGKGGR